MKYVLYCIVVLLIAIAIPLFILAIVKFGAKKKIKVWVQVLIVVASSLVILAGEVFTYFMIYYHASEDANAALADSSEVAVKETGDYYFFDNLSQSEKAIIYYGGAKVEEKAYAPLLRKISEGGVDVFLMKMPFRFALLGSSKADVVMNDFQYDSVYMMGHSLGGTTASMYLSKTSNVYAGIIFLASYPSSKLGDSLKALSIYGSADGVLNKEEYDGNAGNRPSSFTEVVIAGGNHGYFGNYGEQSGDGKATITREEQQTIAASSILGFLS